MAVYESMKDSGIEWMGLIPSHWRIEKAKFNFTQTNNRGNSTPVLLAASQKYGMCPQYMLDGVVKVAENTNLQQFKTVHINDFVISLRSFQGGFERSDYEGVCSPAYQVFSANQSVYNVDYLKHLFKNEMFIDEMNSLTVGIREGKNIKYEDFADSLLFVPPLDEQSAIASYLDDQCAKIDSLIAEAKASIEEYKQWKSSLIFESVTKGLDPNVEMKDSGVKWIGKIPEEWRSFKLCSCFDEIGSGTTPKSDIDDYYNGEIRWLQSGDINGGIVTSTTKAVNSVALEKYTALKIYNAPFIAIAMYGASIANISIVKINACTNQACCVLSKPISKVDYEYIFYAILSAKEELLLSARGGTQPNISQEILKQLRVPIPPLECQKEISKHLNEKCSEIDLIMGEKQQLISDLEAYKKSLIYEVVTGKRKVV
ncbi:MAG: restriction endonuclease subunit S [Acutalibacteraceae bacterium]